MHLLIRLIWLAGAVQLLDAIANLALPRKIRSRENLARVAPIVRQVFTSHWLYIMLVLVIFSLLCFFFAPDLAGGSPLGRFLSGVLAVFWLLRVPFHLFFFDAEFRQQNRAGDIAFLVVSIFLGVVFSVAGLGVVR
jgi:hypothetical protein